MLEWILIHGGRKMAIPYLRVLSGVLWYVSATHLLIGAGVNLVPASLPFLAMLYGAEVSFTPEFTYVLKPLGAFMFVLGLIAAAAARDPLRFRPVIYGFVILFVIRSGQRLVFGQEIAEIFGIDGARNLLAVLFFMALAGLIVGLERAASRAESAA